MTALDTPWQKSVMDLNSNIADVIENLNSTGLRIVLIVNEQGLFEGTISDGDIRRGILRGLSLKTPIVEIIHKGSITVDPQTPTTSIDQLMVKYALQQIPVVDKNMRLVGLHLWNVSQTSTSYNNSVIIMAGGMGRRLSPETDACPKPLLKVSNKPILEHIIERAKDEGFKNFIIAIYHLGHMIESYFGDGSKWGVKITYIRESEPLGTAGALGLLGSVPDCPVIVVNGDIITNVKFGDLLCYHSDNNATATMAVRQYEVLNPFGAVETDGINITGYQEKPISQSIINAGVYVLNSDVLKLIKPNQKYDMPEVFDLVLKKNWRAVAFLVHEQWVDVGTPKSLRLTRDQNESGGI